MGGQSFHSAQAFSCSDGAHPQEARRAAPLLTSSSNTFPDTPAITVGQTPGHPVRGLSSWHIQLAITNGLLSGAHVTFVHKPSWRHVSVLRV